MPYATMPFALVIVVALVVVLVLIALAIQFQRLSRISSHLVRLESMYARSSAAHVEATVAALDADVAKLGKTMRSQFGQVWGTIGQLQAPEALVDDGERPTREQLRQQHLRPPFPVK